MGYLGHLPLLGSIPAIGMWYLMTDATWVILMNKDWRPRIKNPIGPHAVVVSQIKGAIST